MLRRQNYKVGRAIGKVVPAWGDSHDVRWGFANNIRTKTRVSPMRAPGADRRTGTIDNISKGSSNILPTKRADCQSCCQCLKALDQLMHTFHEGRHCPAAQASGTSRRKAARTPRQSHPGRSTTMGDMTRLHRSGPCYSHCPCSRTQSCRC